MNGVWTTQTDKFGNDWCPRCGDLMDNHGDSCYSNADEQDAADFKCVKAAIKFAMGEATITEQNALCKYIELAAALARLFPVLGSGDEVENGA